MTRTVKIAGASLPEWQDKDSAMWGAIRAYDPLAATWGAIERSRKLPRNLRPMNVDCAP